MKTKRSIRSIALLLVLCLCVTMLPATAIAVEAEAPTAEKREVTLADVAAGVADLSDLYNPLDPNTVPEVIGYEEALDNYHSKRVYEDEGDDLNKIVFENLDGTKTMYLFDFPVKYVDTNGKIRDISLEIADASSGGFKTAANAAVTTFSAQASDGISLSGNGTNITLIPIMPTTSAGTQAMTAGSKAGSLGSISADDQVVSRVATRIDEKTIQYRYDSKTTIEYGLTYTGFKEDIVVSEYTGQTEYAFTLRTGGYALEEIDGSYFLVDEAGNIKATIGDIIIFTADERNNTMGQLVPKTIVENEEYLLTIVVDLEFLADENTAYPIRIDPTVEINYANDGAGAIQDATVYTDDTTNGALGSIFVGLKQNGGIARILMKFPGLDLDSLGEDIHILSATVTLRDLLCESTSLDVYCHVYAGAVWNESNVCWDNTIAVSPNYLSTQLDMKTISYSIGTALPEQHRYSFDVTLAVRGWLGGNYDQNKGIVFKANSSVENGSTYNWRTMGSYNRASYKPTLSVVYVEIDNIPVPDGSYYINNDNTGKYMRYTSSGISGQSGLLANLGTSIQWEVICSSNGKGYVIRAKNDPTKYLAVPESVSSNNVELVSVSNTEIPDRCYWSISIADGGCLIRSNYNSKYLYSSGTGVYTSSTTGTVGTSAYYSRVWRIVSISLFNNTLSGFRELSDNTTISNLELAINADANITVNKQYSNETWVNTSDFTYQFTNSEVASYSNNAIVGNSYGGSKVVATHKVTGKTKNFYVIVGFSSTIESTPLKEHIIEGLNQAHDVWPASEESRYYWYTTQERADAIVGIRQAAFATAVGGWAINNGDAASMLLHFLNNSGEIYIVDMDDLLETWDTAQLDRQIVYNYLIQAAEASATSSVKTLRTIEAIGFVHEESSNWGRAIGSYSVSICCTYKKTSATTYTMTITYELHDVYDWDRNNVGMGFMPVSPADMWELHHAGAAKNYEVFGTKTVTITWNEGETVGGGIELYV